MTRDSRTAGYRRTPPWRVRAGLIERLLLNDVFPGEAGYPTSQWALWDMRIRAAQEAETALHQQRYEAHGSQPSNDTHDDPPDWLLEEWSESLRLTKSMYAALIVAIWAEVEHFLKGILATCYLAQNRRELALQAVRDCCDAMLARRETKVSLKDCIRHLKQLDGDTPYAFAELSEAFRKEVKVVIEDLPDFATVDAIRVLNNCFKHSRGCYRARSDKPGTQIAKSVIRKWNDGAIDLEGNGEIDYSKLPVRDLVLACNAFFAALLGRIESLLARWSIKPSGSEGSTRRRKA